ncbi:MAG: DUF362 domain-containing protein [Kiritimatiellae bacterium]|nr:DUF362 domain-containing protein [Kiritimatiellia bacterium]MDD5521813.1 DUF362 domain-containing protein [Kiritimatiellia bacterium]
MPIVVVAKLNKDLTGLCAQFSGAFDSIGLSPAFNKSQAIFIKPNLTYPNFKEGVTTGRDFVAALVAALRNINTKTKIYIGEGEGGYNSFSMTDAMRNMGFYEIAQNYPNVGIINLSKLGTRIVELTANGKLYPLMLPEIFFREIDFSITCPLPKVHCMTGISLSLKNQWGCLPDVMRLKNHYVFDEIIGQICEKLKFRYAFLDGKYGLDNNGPMMGDPVEVNWFVASNSLGAFDMVVSDMMGFDWQRIGHLKMAERYGFMPTKDEIKIIGDPDSVRREFTLKRDFWNYPALAAFHSKKLTHLFYFSMWSKLLHDVMYTFRKKPIS